MNERSMYWSTVGSYPLWLWGNFLGCALKLQINQFKVPHCSFYLCPHCQYSKSQKSKSTINLITPTSTVSATIWLSEDWWHSTFEGSLQTSLDLAQVRWRGQTTLASTTSHGAHWGAVRARDMVQWYQHKDSSSRGSQPHSWSPIKAIWCGFLGKS